MFLRLWFLFCFTFLLTILHRVKAEYQKKIDEMNSNITETVRHRLQFAQGLAAAQAAPPSRPSKPLTIDLTQLLWQQTSK